MPPVPHLMLASNSVWNLIHFRAPLIEAFVRQGARLSALVPEGEDARPLERLGVAVHHVPLDRAGTSILRDGGLFIAYLQHLRRLRPDALLGFTAKPNIYGGLAARMAGIPAINNISGLGTGFLRGGALRWLMGALYRLSLGRATVVFFQNDDDLRLFVDKGWVRPGRAALLAGSGVDLAAFTPSALPNEGGVVRFLLVARMLRDKGVEEFVEAARMLRGEPARFVLLGPAGDDNPSAIAPERLREWSDEGIIDWLGAAADVRPHLAAADVVVLPSYREGMPRTLLEAAASGRPVVASDVPGCRQAVRTGSTGWLCEARDARSLATAMKRMIDAGPSGRSAMGRANRERAEAEFGTQSIVEAYNGALERCGIRWVR